MLDVLFHIAAFWCIVCASASPHQCATVAQLPVNVSGQQLGYGTDPEIVYLFGGSQLNFSTIYKWNITSNTYLQLPIETPATDFYTMSNNMVQISNLMYFIGMHGDPSIHIFNALTEKWLPTGDIAPVPTMLFDPSVVGGCLTANDTHLFFIGGIETATSTLGLTVVAWSHMLKIYDIYANTWVEESIPQYETQFGHGWSDGYCQTAHQNLYIFGGCTRELTSGTDLLSTILKWHPTINFSIIDAQWNTSGIGAGYGVALRHYDSIYLIGGVSAEDPFTIHHMNVIYEFDTISETITNTYWNIMAQGVSQTAAAIINDKLYLFGGDTRLASLDVRALDDVQICGIFNSTSTTAPTSYLSSTSNPTQDPTVQPSHSPIQNITSYPTEFPSSTATPGPSKDPTTQPSHSPLQIITSYPTEFPNNSATSYPSHHPTKYPINTLHTNVATEYKSTDFNENDIDTPDWTIIWTIVLIAVCFLLVVCGVVGARFMAKDSVSTAEQNIKIQIDEDVNSGSGNVVALEIVKYETEVDDEGITKGNALEAMGDEYVMENGVTTPKGVQMMDVDAYRQRVGSDANGQLLEVQEWFENVLEMPQHFDAFVSNGYETMLIIKEISGEQELEEIGISLKKHRIQILQQIETWEYENIVVENKKSEGDYWDDRVEKDVRHETTSGGDLHTAQGTKRFITNN